MRLAEEERAWRTEQLFHAELKERMEKLERTVATLQAQQNETNDAHNAVLAKQESRWQHNATGKKKK